MKAWMSSNFDQIPPPTLELSALARLQKLMYNVVTTLAPLFLIRSASFLQVRRTTIKPWTTSKGGRALSPFFGPLQKPKYESYRTTSSSRCFIS